MKYLLMVLIVYIGFTPSSYAAFGFGPCCSGFFCGIIPCDRTCAGAALTSFGNSTANGMNQSSKSLDNLTRETLTSGENYLKYIEKATSTKTQYFSSLTAGISAMVSKIELSELNDQTTIQSLFNVVNNEWSSANKSTKKLEAFYENSRRYGEGAQSLTMSKHLEYSGANEMELQSKKINLSNALQQATNLDKESAANNWTTQLK